MILAKEAGVMPCPQSLDFAADLLAIQERPPERLPRVLLALVTALLLLLLVWAMVAKLDVIASAQGRLVPTSFTQVVQPAEAGVVTEILVKDGDAVQQGQLLMRLDARAAKGDAQTLERELVLRQLTLNALKAELLDQPVVLQAPAHAHVDLAMQVAAQFRARRSALNDALGQEHAALNRAQADLAAAQQVQLKLVQTLPSYQHSAQAYQKLLKEGFIGELAANDKLREAQEKEQDLKAQAATVASLQAAIAQSEKRMAALRSQYRSQLENERIEAMAQLNRGSQELSKSSIRADMLDIRAPHAGVVKDLATTTRGAVVAAGALLMNIVPQGEALQAEVLLLNEDVGFVAKGQSAKIKIAAYPFQRYGLLDGQVSMLSADSMDPKQQTGNGMPNLSYRAFVQLNTDSLRDANGQRLPLSAGMLVTAEIHQGRRTVMEYLLSPVLKVAQEAGRER